MEQTNLNFSFGDVDLPDLVFGPKKYRCGEAFKLLRKGEKLSIVGEDRAKISPKVDETVFILENGERVIITKRKPFPKPTAVDGVLFDDGTGTLAWREHCLIDAIKSRDESEGLARVADDIAETWEDAIKYKAESRPIQGPSDFGLRPPQLGALFAVGSHWSLHRRPATIVMPTGTGKTETMLAVQVAHQIGRLLVAVPTKALRTQTAGKFLNFGLLREIGVLSKSTETPVVGILMKRPKSEQDLEIFQHCNVVVGTVTSLAGGTASHLLEHYPKIVDTLMVDEAHHIPAGTWAALKAPFFDKRVLQFTATPFRNDGKLVDGTVIYSYPLHAAQEDGYFKEIDFLPVHQIDDELVDTSIAKVAVEKLKSDLSAGHDHILMARCQSKERAERVHEIYKALAPNQNPLLLHSEIVDADERVQTLRDQKSRIVTCVNMLGEGVDIPSLKIAAIHDKHQSLAVLLQFIGRFTRKGGNDLGNASVVANTADPKVSSALEELYSEDADWNGLLREMSSEAAKEHAAFMHFLENSNDFGVEDDELPSISNQSLRPVFSTLFFEAPEFRPKNFVEGLSDKFELVKVWVNDETQTLYFVTRSVERVRWANTKELKHVEWHIFVLHYDAPKKLLYLASSYKDSGFEGLAQAVGATKQIFGEEMFRTLGGIGRLVFNNLGVTKHGRRNLSFAMYTGADVKQALSETEKKGSRKSNVSGYGWENGKQITIGCSYRGRVWSKAGGTLPSFISWAEHIGGKLIDETIDTKSVIANVLIPEYATVLPDYDILAMEWPYELLTNSEERISLGVGGRDYDWLDISIEWKDIDRNSRSINFMIVTGDERESIAEYQLIVDGEVGFTVTESTSNNIMLRIGRKEVLLADFLNDYPPLIRFVDLSELDGNILLSAEDSGVVELPTEQMEAWDWSGVDITKESIWKNGEQRIDSIQWATAQTYIEAGYSIVFDDDGCNEAADLICLKVEEDHIRLALVHCKFSDKSVKGRRLKDVVEVSSQAIRSARWPGHFRDLVLHMKKRCRTRKIDPARSLFLRGSLKDLDQVLREARFKEVRPEILVVQPGVTKVGLTDNQSSVLGAAAAFLKQTLNIEIGVICSD